MAIPGIEIITKYFPDLTERQTALFQKLDPLYRTWNEKINVVSRKDIDNLFINHVLHSLSIAKLVTFNSGASILDVGTGGGFPGIPLAILYPETNFHLVDSIGKKITVVQAVADGLQLKNVKAEQVRAEQVKGEYDFIISRAVTRIKELYGWTYKKVKKQSSHKLDNGIICLKGGDLEGEMDELKRPYSMTELSAFFNEPFFETKKIIYVPV